MDIKDTLNNGDLFASGNGMCLTEIGGNFAVATMTVEKRHLNAAGVCQGGALFTLADFAIAGVMNAGGKVTVGVENTIAFHRPGLEGDVLYAKATMTNEGKTIASCRVEVRNQDNTLIASGTGLSFRR